MLAVIQIPENTFNVFNEKKKKTQQTNKGKKLVWEDWNCFGPWTCSFFLLPPVSMSVQGLGVTN